MSFHQRAIEIAREKWKQDLGQAYKDYSRVIANLAILDESDKDRRKALLKDLRNIRIYIAKIQWILSDEHIFDDLKPITIEDKHEENVIKTVQLNNGELEDTNGRDGLRQEGVRKYNVRSSIRRIWIYLRRVL